MDNLSHQSSKRTLPNTPRVSDKIMEYYAKYGHGRDLEKFMRLYSPASSQESQSTQDGIISNANIEGCCTHIRSQETICSDCNCIPSTRPLGRCCKDTSKSLPNIDVHERRKNDDEKSFPAKDMIIDINIEADKNENKVYEFQIYRIVLYKNLLEVLTRVT